MNFNLLFKSLVFLNLLGMLPLRTIWLILGVDREFIRTYYWRIYIYKSYLILPILLILGISGIKLIFLTLEKFDKAYKFDQLLIKN